MKNIIGITLITLLIGMAVGLGGCQALNVPPTATTIPTLTPFPTNTPVPTETPTPVPTSTLTSTPEPTWKANIHLGAAGSMAELTPMPFEEINLILPVLRERENEYLADQDIEPNETYLTYTELLPGHPFSVFTVDVMDTWGEKGDLVIASTNVLVDQSGKKYFLIGKPHLVRQREGEYFDPFVWHYLVDIKAMERYFVSIGIPDLIESRSPDAVLQRISQGLDRVLEMRVFVYGEPYNEVLIAGQGWQDIEPILRKNEEQFNIHSRMDKLYLDLDKVGEQIDISLLTDLETVVLPVTWFDAIK